MRTSTLAALRVGVILLPAFLVAVADDAAAGLARPEPGTIAPDQFRKGEDIFKIRLPNKPHAGPLARCPVCGKPLKDHVDPNFVCRSPDLDAAAPDARKVTCPVCAHTFRAFVPDAESRGRMDMDFCRHPKGTGALASEIWMCAKCGYASPYWSFANPVGPKTKEFVQTRVTPATKERLSAMIGLKLEAFAFDDFSFLDQPSIPEFMKSENALAIHDKAGAGPFLMAKLHLGAAHAFRRMLNRPLAAMGLDRAIRRVDALLVNELVATSDPLELAKVFKRALAKADAPGALDSAHLSSLERFCICMRLAGLHDRLGEGWWSKRYLDTADRLARAQQKDNVRMSLLALVAERRNVLSREFFHLTRAAALLKQGLSSGDIPRQEFVTSVYLAGELLARIGEPASALPWLSAARDLVKERPREGNDAAAQTARLVAAWSRLRLDCPLFFVTDKAGGRTRITAKHEDAQLVARIVPSARRAGPPPAKVPATEPVEPVPVEPTTPREETDEPAAAAGTCEGLMRRVWSAIEAYRAAHQGSFPPNADALTRQMGIDRSALVCPETGKPLFYRRPPAGSGRTFILFHADPAACPCKLMLFSDGSTGEFGQ